MKSIFGDISTFYVKGKEAMGRTHYHVNGRENEAHAELEDDPPKLGSWVGGVLE
jgi:hypothetical protein